MKLACIVVLFLLAACADKEEVPKKLIAPNEMQSVLWDMLLADRYASQYIVKDTAKSLKIENLRLYDQVFQIHKITKAQFIESFEYYLDRPDLSKIMFDSLSAGANKKRGEVYISAPKE